MFSLKLSFGPLVQLLAALGVLSTLLVAFTIGALG